MGQKILIESANRVLAFFSTEKQTRNHRSFLELHQEDIWKEEQKCGLHSSCSNESNDGATTGAFILWFKLINVLTNTF